MSIDIQYRTAGLEKLGGLVTTDKQRVQQVLLNLLSNALKFSENGQVKIKARVLWQREWRLRIQVRDTGVGISKQD